MNPYRSQDVNESMLSVLRPEDAKRHSDGAWRNIWSRNPATASRLWRKYHPGETAPEGCVLVDLREAA